MESGRCVWQSQKLSQLRRAKYRGHYTMHSQLYLTAITQHRKRRVGCRCALLWLL